VHDSAIGAERRYQGQPGQGSDPDTFDAQPLLISGWVRTGHPEAQSSRLVAEIAAAATRVTGMPAQRILVVIQNSPAHFAIEGGRVLPAPGEEEAWLREQQEAD
jgi:phenylpyruvate tautomerase PptA (4-oxalocrotonate tautomerase family)